jgi:hypothetical protein
MAPRRTCHRSREGRDAGTPRSIRTTPCEQPPLGRARSRGTPHGEEPAEHRDPQEQDDLRDQCVGTVGRPEPIAGPGRTTEQDEHDCCYARREEPLRDDARAREPERSGHDEHRRREARNHREGKCKIGEPGCHLEMAEVSDREREPRPHGHAKEQDGSQCCAGSGRRCAPSPPDRHHAERSRARSEPEQFQEGKAENDGGDQNPSAVSVEEREELGGRRAELRLIAVNEERDDDQDDENDAAAAPGALPVLHGTTTAF